MNILMLVGSLRADSWTARLTGSAAALLPEGAEATAYDGLGELPHYDQDLDTDQPPASVVAFREAVRRRRRPGRGHPGVQRLDAGRAQERDRLGLPPAR